MIRLSFIILILAIAKQGAAQASSLKNEELSTNGNAKLAPVIIDLKRIDPQTGESAIGSQVRENLEAVSTMTEPVMINFNDADAMLNMNIPTGRRRFDQSNVASATNDYPDSNLVYPQYPQQEQRPMGAESRSSRYMRESARYNKQMVAHMNGEQQMNQNRNYNRRSLVANANYDAPQWGNGQGWQNGPRAKNGGGLGRQESRSRRAKQVVKDDIFNEDDDEDEADRRSDEEDDDVDEPEPTGGARRARARAMNLRAAAAQQARAQPRYRADNRRPQQLNGGEDSDSTNTMKRAVQPRAGMKQASTSGKQQVVKRARSERPNPIQRRSSEEQPAGRESYENQSAASQQLKDTPAELETAAGHHHGKHHSHYYQYAEVPKKKAWKFGFKRGNHKHTIERHEKGYKNKFHSSFKWHATEKCKKKKKCKSMGKMTWDYKHHDKKHHGYHG